MQTTDISELAANLECVSEDVMTTIFSFLDLKDLAVVYDEFATAMKKVKIAENIVLAPGSNIFDRYPNAEVFSLEIDRFTDHTMLRRATKLNLYYTENCPTLIGLCSVPDLQDLTLTNHSGPTSELGYLSKLKSLKLNCTSPISGRTLSFLMNLRKVDFEDMRLDDDLFDALKQVTSFSCTNCEFDCKCLSKLENLESLRLDEVGCVDEDLTPLKNLTSLTIRTCDGLSGACFQDMVHLTNLQISMRNVWGGDFLKLTELRSVHLTDCTFLTDVAFADSPLIETLTICGCPEIKGTFVECLPNLKNLTMTRCPNAVLQARPGLIMLDLVDIELAPQMLTDTETIKVLHVRSDRVLCGIENLQLHELLIIGNLANANVIRQLVTLQKLFAIDCNIDDESIGCLMNLTHLQVSECPHFSGHCLRSLRKLSSLSVNSCKTFDERSLRCFTELESLNITKSGITGIGFSSFRRIGALSLCCCSKFRQGNLHHIRFRNVNTFATRVDIGFLRVAENFSA